MYGIQSDAAINLKEVLTLSSHEYVLEDLLYLVQEHANIKSVELF